MPGCRATPGSEYSDSTVAKTGPWMGESLSGETSCLELELCMALVRTRKTGIAAAYDLECTTQVRPSEAFYEIILTSPLDGSSTFE
jgi:hypothetical protein